MSFAKSGITIAEVVVVNSPAIEEVATPFRLAKITPVSTLIKKGMIHSAHDCSDGGLFIALAESSISSGKGFDISTDESIRTDAFLFGEAQSRVVVTVRPGDEEKFLHEMMERDVDFCSLGTVMGDEMTVDEEAYFKVEEVKNMYDNALENILK